jgi:opacity protein-like surface antigen
LPARRPEPLDLASRNDFSGAGCGQVASSKVLVRHSGCYRWSLLKALIRGRVGLAIDYAFMYVTGGYASADVQREQALIFTNGNNFIASGSERKDGWVYGGGFEYNLFGGWSLTTEILHIELDDDTLVAPNLPAFPLDQTVTTDAETSFDVVRAGVTYRFW